MAAELTTETPEQTRARYVSDETPTLAGLLGGTS